MLKRFIQESAANQGRNRGAQGVWLVNDDLIAKFNLPQVGNGRNARNASLCCSLCVLSGVGLIDSRQARMVEMILNLVWKWRSAAESGMRLNGAEAAMPRFSVRPPAQEPPEPVAHLIAAEDNNRMVRAARATTCRGEIDSAAKKSLPLSSRCRHLARPNAAAPVSGPLPADGCADCRRARERRSRDARRRRPQAQPHGGLRRVVACGRLGRHSWPRRQLPRSGVRRAEGVRAHARSALDRRGGRAPQGGLAQGAHIRRDEGCGARGAAGGGPDGKAGGKAAERAAAEEQRARNVLAGRLIRPRRCGRRRRTTFPALFLT